MTHSRFLYPVTFTIYNLQVDQFKGTQMFDSPASNKGKTARAISAVQHGDNIAHALAGAGGGLLSLMLT